MSLFSYPFERANRSHATLPDSSVLWPHGLYDNTTLVFLALNEECGIVLDIYFNSRYLNINSQPILRTSNLVWANSWRISFIQFSNIKDWSPWWSTLWKYLLSFVDKYHKNIDDFLSCISTWTYSRQFHGFRVTKNIVKKSKWMLDMTCRAHNVPPISHNRGYSYSCKGTNIEKYTLRRWGHDC